MAAAHADEPEWQPHPFPGPITNMGAYRGGYASLWFPEGKIKVIPAACGLLTTVVDPDGRSRTPYSKDKKGKPKHISRRWLSEGLGTPSPVPNGFHDVANDGTAEIFIHMRRLPDGIELRAESGVIVSLRCEFTVCGAPPVDIAIVPGDVHDNQCSVCSTNAAPKRCLQKRCGLCCESKACIAHKTSST